MPDRGYSQIAVPKFGLEYGLSAAGRGPDAVSADPLAVPLGSAISCQNVVAYPGSVSTRPGFTQKASFTALAVNSLKEYVLSDTTKRRLLAFTSDGVLQTETGSFTYNPATFSLVEASLASARFPMFESVTLFGREYGTIRLNGPVQPYNFPFSWDDTNLDLVSPSRPGLAPVVTPTTGGTMAPGTHSFRVCFVTRSGYITPPGPAVVVTTFTATNNAANISGIPTGPSWVLARLIVASPESSADYYYISGTSMVIADNTTTSVNGVTFTDSALISGVPISVADQPNSDLLNLVHLPAQGSVFAYHDRLCWLNERNSITELRDFGFRNMKFDGGFGASGNANLPNGWNERLAGELNPGFVPGMFGAVLAIQSDGTTNARGQLANQGSALAILPPGVEIRARVRCRKDSTLTAGTFHVYIVDSSTGNTPAGAGIDQSAMSSTEFRIIDYQVLAANANTPTATWELRVSSGGSGGGTALAPSGKNLYVDSIELYRGDQPYSPSRARWSWAQQPDAYHSTTGLQAIDPDNGQIATCGFVIGDNAYICKERSLYVTRDDGANEPANWPISQVSANVGTPSPQGMALGDQWAILACRAGLYYFSGGQPILLSDFVRNEWKRINWLYGYAVWVRVDVENRFIYVGVPLDGATRVNTIFSFQWFGQSPIQSIVSSLYGVTGQGLEFNKWSFSDSPATSVNCAAWSERSDGTRHLYIGTNTDGSHANGYVAQLDEPAVNDTLATSLNIVSKYRFAFMGFPSGVSQFGRVVANISGSGSLAANVYLPDNATVLQPAMPSVPLDNLPKGDYEWGFLNYNAERVSPELVMNQPGGWFSLHKFVLFGKEKTFFPERGLRKRPS